MNSPSQKPLGHRGFTLPEFMISIAIFSSLCLGLLMGFVALERNFAAAADFSINHADEMRISDYMALDLRRALAVTAGENDTTISIPNYYDTHGNPNTPTLDGNGGVYYGAAGSIISIHYYLANGTIYRKQGHQPAVALANNVQDFRFNVTDLGKVVQTRITFSPTFRFGASPGDNSLATAFYNTTLLRNSRTDITSSLY
jgi:prepilin-type N-terminal cleavage/methylation domain-containing protein